MKVFIPFACMVMMSFISNGQSFAYKTLLQTIYDKDFPTLQPQDLLSSQTDYLLLDIREKNEFEVSHIKGAKLVEYSKFSVANISTIPKNQPIVVYCSIGARSQEIGKKLKDAGYSQVYNLYGGVFHWVNEGNPVYNQQGKTTKIHGYNKKWGIWLSKGEKVYD
jgi:rhodanese-related sulfurtransferase